MFTDQDWLDAERTQTLGPHYHAADRVCKEAMQGFTEEMMKPLVADAVEAFQDKLWDHMRDFLWSDTEMNLQTKMWHMVDDIVKAILGGNEWAIKRYVLGERYECQDIRKAIAAEIPEQLQAAEVKDLRARVEQLEKDNQWLRERY